MWEIMLLMVVFMLTCSCVRERDRDRETERARHWYRVNELFWGWILCPAVHIIFDEKETVYGRVKDG